MDLALPHPCPLPKERVKLLNDEHNRPTETYFQKQVIGSIRHGKSAEI
jgi:hypothetical protein